MWDTIKTSDTFVNSFIFMEKNVIYHQNVHKNEAVVNFIHEPLCGNTGFLPM